METKRAHLSQRISEAQVGREESSERTELLQNLAERKEQKKKLEAELEKYKACDPERMKQLQSETTVAKEAANRWTGMSLYLMCVYGE